MADINKTVSVNYSADVSGLLKEVKKLPSVTQKEAAAMTKALSSNLKKSEIAAKKAAVTTQKSFQKMGKSAAAAGNQYRKLKRTASELGRGFGEIALLVGESDSAMGQMAMQASGLAMTASALAPLVGTLGGAIKSLGLVAGGLATGGLTILVGTIGMLISSQAAAEEAQKKNKEKLDQLNKSYKKYNDLIEKAKSRSGDLARKIIDARDAVSALRDEVEIERLTLAAQVDPKFIEDLEGLKEKVAFREIERRVQKTFEGVNTALSTSLSAQADLTENARKRVGTILQGDFVSEDLKKAIGIVTPDDFDRIESYFEKVKKGYSTIAQTAEGPVMLTEEDFKNSQRLLKDLKEYRDQNAILQKQEQERIAFMQIRNKEELELTQALKDNFVNQRKITEEEKKKEKSSTKGSKSEERSNEIQAQKNTLLKIENSLKEELLTKDQKRLKEIDDQISSLETMWERNQDISKGQSDWIDVSQAINLLLGKRAKLEKEIADNINQSSIADDTKKEIDLYRKLFEERKIGFEELNDLKFKYMGSELEHEKEIHEEILRMIEERNEKAKAGIKANIDFVGAFGSSMLTTLKNVNSENVELINAMFALQQASSVGNIAMSTSENVTKAQGYPPPLNIMATAAAIAVGAAQTAAVLSQTPPKKHMGGSITQENQYTLLRGEAVLDRSTVRNLGGERGVRKLQERRGSPEVVVLQPYKHFDRYLKGRDRRQKRNANTGY